MVISFSANDIAALCEAGSKTARATYENRARMDFINCDKRSLA